VRDFHSGAYTYPAARASLAANNRRARSSRCGDKDAKRARITSGSIIPTEYGIEFASVVAHDNVVATQFHAEKSGGLGLRLLAEFAAWDGRC